MTRNETALTTLASVNGTSGPTFPAGRVDVAFTAQLLAVRLDSPTYRQRRRIEPALGIAAYRDRLGQTAQFPPAAALQA